MSKDFKESDGIQRLTDRMELSKKNVVKTEFGKQKKAIKIGRKSKRFNCTMQNLGKV